MMRRLVLSAKMVVGTNTELGIIPLTKGLALLVAIVVLFEVPFESTEDNWK